MEANKRIQDCINNNKTQLNLSLLGLIKLPENLPNGLQELNCCYNQIIKLPEKFT